MAFGDQDSPVTLTGHSVTLNCSLKVFEKPDPEAIPKLLAKLAALKIQPKEQLVHSYQPPNPGRYIGRVVAVDLYTADQRMWDYDSGHTFTFHYSLTGSEGLITISDLGGEIYIAFDTSKLKPGGDPHIYSEVNAELEHYIEVTSQTGATDYLSIPNPSYCQIQLFMKTGA
jgi:hypothetical protein